MKRTGTATETKPSKQMKLSGANRAAAAAAEPLLSLDCFAANVIFYGICFSESEEAFKVAYQKYISPNYKLDENGQFTNFKVTFPRVIAQHKIFNDCYLTSQDFVVSPADSEGNSGDVAIIMSGTVNQEGAVVTANTVSILKIEYVPLEHGGPGKQQVVSMHVVVSFTSPIPSPPTPAQLSLEAFVASTFFGTWIQADDEVFEILFKKDYSTKVKEDENGVTLTPKAFHKFVVQTRKELSNRKLVNQSCIVNVGDPQGRTGQVAHTFRGSAIKDGLAVTFKVVSVADVIFHTDIEEELGGHRQISIQSFVCEMKLE